MILCLTPNPAIDRTLIVPALQPGEVHRATRAIVAAGGKGLNVARAIRTLRVGGDPLCLGFLGGHSGRLLAELTDREGLRTRWTWIEGETRTCVIVVDGDATVFNEPGPTVTADDWARLRGDVVAIDAELVCFSGSLPPGSPIAAFTNLARELQQAGRQVWVDTSNSPLEDVLSAGVNIKVNGAEAGAVLKTAVRTVDEAVAAASRMREHGGGSVVVTLGALGAVMVNDEGLWLAQAPSIRTVSAVGSGDAFLAGLVTALEKRKPPAEALHCAVAAGAANAMSAGGGTLALEDYEQLLARISP